MWCKRKCDSSDQASFFHCSVVQFWCSRAHCRCFQQWTDVSMGTLTGLWLHSPICNKLWCTVCSDTYLLEPALTFSAIWATVACLIRPCGPAFSPHVHQWALTAHDLVAIQRSSILGPLLTCTDHCRPGTPHNSCSFGHALTQLSSHHNLPLVKSSFLRMPIFPALNNSKFLKQSL